MHLNEKHEVKARTAKQEPMMLKLLLLICMVVACLGEEEETMLSAVTIDEKTIELVMMTSGTE